jgi:hypothetical protein
MEHAAKTVEVLQKAPTGTRIHIVVSRRQKCLKKRYEFKVFTRSDLFQSAPSMIGREFSVRPLDLKALLQYDTYQWERATLHPEWGALVAASRPHATRP